MKTDDQWRNTAPFFLNKKRKGKEAAHLLYYSWAGVVGVVVVAVFRSTNVLVSKKSQRQMLHKGQEGKKEGEKGGA